MDFKSAFNQVKGFSLGFLATPAALVDQFVLPDQNKKLYCDRLSDAVGNIPEAKNAAIAGVVVSGTLVFSAVVALFDHAISGPRIGDVAPPEKAKVEVQASQQVATGKIIPVQGETAQLAPARSLSR